MRDELHRHDRVAKIRRTMFEVEIYARGLREMGNILELDRQLVEIAGLRYKVDTNRVYLTGLSMGGFGAWNLSLKFPERFAAVAPICGGGNPYYPIALTARRKAALKSLPFWAFHGDKDDSVAIEESERMVNALKKFGCEVKFTVYPGVGHDSWTQTYGNPQLYEWFLEHERR